MHKCIPWPFLIRHAYFAILVSSAGSAFFFAHEIGPDVADELRASSRSEASKTGAQTSAQNGTQGWDLRQWSINEHGEQGQERSTSMVSMSAESGTCQERGNSKCPQIWEHAKSRGT